MNISKANCSASKWSNIDLACLGHVLLPQENLPANGELAHVKRLLAASAAHIAVKMQGCVRVTLKDGVVVAKPLSGRGGGNGLRICTEVAYPNNRNAQEGRIRYNA